MGQLKEADFIRWGNTKRITGLRKAEQDGIWESIKDRMYILSFLHAGLSDRGSPLDNFDEYWRIASKVTPSATPAPSFGSPGSAPMHVRPPSIDAGGVPERDSAYTVRCVPVRIYLPDGPFIQELVPPLLEDGRQQLLDSSRTIPFTPLLHRHTAYPLSLLVNPSASTISAALDANRVVSSQPTNTSYCRTSLCVDTGCCFTAGSRNGMAGSMSCRGRRLAQYLHWCESELIGDYF